MQEQDLSFSAGSTGPLHRSPASLTATTFATNLLTSSYGAKRSKPKEKGCSVHVSLGSVVVAAGP